MKNVMIFIPLLLLSASCMSESFSYKYISLEDIPQIQVVSYGRAELQGLKSDNEMPIRYELARDAYLLTFEIDKENYWPSIFISAMSLNDSSYIINPIEIGNCGGFEDFGISYMIEGYQAMKYTWSPAFSMGCEVEGNEGYPSQQIIAFRVRNPEGSVLGEERLPFTLIENGTYYEQDGL